MLLHPFGSFVVLLVVAVLAGLLRLGGALPPVQAATTFVLDSTNDAASVNTGDDRSATATDPNGHTSKFSVPRTVKEPVVGH